MSGRPVPWRRRAGWLALVAAVFAVHACVTETLVVRLNDAAGAAAMPTRIEVAYVREMALAAPLVAAPAVGMPRLRSRTALARAAPKPEPAASAASAALAASADPLIAAAPEPPASDVSAEPPEPPVLATDSAAAPVADAASAASAPAVLAAASAPQPAASEAAAGFVWPASTRVRYELTGNFRGPVTGSAQVEWVHVGSRYQVHLDMLIGPEFAPIVSRRMSSDGRITATGLVPQRYDQETRVMLREPSRATVLLEPDGVVLANGERRPTVPDVQDTASQFIQLSFRFGTEPGLLQVGNSVTIPLALPRTLDAWTYDMVDEELLYTNFGPLATVHLKPRPRPPRPGELRAEIWFAPQLRHLPVRIRVQQDDETWIDLLIAKRPELAAP